MRRPKAPSRRAIRLSLNWQAPGDDPPEKRMRLGGQAEAQGEMSFRGDEVENTPPIDDAQAPEGRGRKPHGDPEGFAPRKRGAEKSAHRQMAEAAGMSLHKMRQAMAVAAVPEAEFERMVESENPPTLTRLAEIGRGAPARKRPRRLFCCPHCGGDLSEDTE